MTKTSDKSLLFLTSFLPAFKIDLMLRQQIL
jgi:hypothetical protein